MFVSYRPNRSSPARPLICESWSIKITLHPPLTIFRHLRFTSSIPIAPESSNMILLFSGIPQQPQSPLQILPNQGPCMCRTCESTCDSWESHLSTISDPGISIDNIPVLIPKVVHVSHNGYSQRRLAHLGSSGNHNQFRPTNGKAPVNIREPGRIPTAFMGCVCFFDPVQVVIHDIAFTFWMLSLWSVVWIFIASLCNISSTASPDSPRRAASWIRAATART